MMRQAAFFSDNNYQDYEFTRLNTYEKKEMSIIVNYWKLLSEKTSRLRRKEETSLYKIILCGYLYI